MRRSITTLLLVASLAGASVAAMAQEVTERGSLPISNVAPSDGVDIEAYVAQFRYNARAEDVTRRSCGSCATLDGDDGAATESPPCTIASGWASDECVSGVDRGGHSKGKYL